MLWLVFLLASNVDIGFLRKGNPFFAFAGSRATGGFDGIDRSEAVLAPGGRFPIGGAFWRSVGLTKDEVTLAALAGGGGWGLLLKVGIGALVPEGETDGEAEAIDGALAVPRCCAGWPKAACSRR